MTDWTVGQIIEELKRAYQPDEKIVCVWWDKSLPYLDREITRPEWEKALELIGEEEFGIPNSIVWDTITEKLTEVTGEYPK